MLSEKQCEKQCECEEINFNNRSFDKFFNFLSSNIASARVDFGMVSLIIQGR